MSCGNDPLKGGRFALCHTRPAQLSVAGHGSDLG
jgi:hypothetical protein